MFSKFEKKDVESVYGIGSFFESSLEITSDIDVVVLLRDVELAPTLDWTVARFEKEEREGVEIWYLYGDLDHYLDPDMLESISITNWSWAVRSLKFGSTLLYGKDIRDQLPVPPYNTPQIFKRSMYYLEPTPDWKFERAEKEGIEIDEELRFSKSIFKYGFFLVASVFPDENKFKKLEIYELLKKAVELRLVNSKILEFYERALEYRSGTPFPNFTKYRKKFMLFSIQEAMRHLETTWKGNEEKKGVADLLSEGMGSYPFASLRIYYEHNGLKK